MCKKLTFGVLIACTAAFGFNYIKSAHADTLTGCNVIACSDAFFLNGAAISDTVSFDFPPGDTDFPTNHFTTFAPVLLNLHVIYLFTEEGTGTSSTALVSDIVRGGIITFSDLNYFSDPFERLDVAGAEAFFGPSFNYQVVEETGSPQSLTAFNPDLTIQFGSDVAAVPGPIAGAGLPGLIAACGVLLVLARRRRKIA